ncbi:DUF1819 family protein [Megasphaera paucivorans]|uniref:Putative inner membrane protein n=1 Tax=Megasphaera paucivorans TaxID=349095 RepID=A0A1H0A2E0_9FIRM|nr:DUF1819 family protein [Megasphaera paucivorans]SDN26836.1 Putative inner membrane protein [Megasphaera paucivorans]
MKKKEYSAGAVKLSFWFMEFRKVICLLNQGKTFEEIKVLNRKQNIFGASTVDRADTIYNTVVARIQCLSSSFYTVFLHSDIATQKLFVLTAVMAHDTLFFDFVYEIIREKMIIGINEYADSDIRIFFKNKQVQSKKVACWTDATLARLGRCYKTMLFEAGMTDKGKTVRVIYKPILDAPFRQWLTGNGMELVMNALAGVR